MHCRAPSLHKVARQLICTHLICAFTKMLCTTSYVDICTDIVELKPPPKRSRAFIHVDGNFATHVFATGMLPHNHSEKCAHYLCIHITASYPITYTPSSHTSHHITHTSHHQHIHTITTNHQSRCHQRQYKDYNCCLHASHLIFKDWSHVRFQTQTHVRHLCMGMITMTETLPVNNNNNTQTHHYPQHTVRRSYL